MGENITIISLYLTLIILVKTTAYSNERLNYSIKANHSDGSAGITYFSGEVKIN